MDELSGDALDSRARGQRRAVLERARLRRRFGELVREEVRETVGPDELEDEVQQLLRALK